MKKNIIKFYIREKDSYVLMAKLKYFKDSAHFIYFDNNYRSKSVVQKYFWIDYDKNPNIKENLVFISNGCPELSITYKSEYIYFPGTNEFKDKINILDGGLLKEKKKMLEELMHNGNIYFGY